MVTKGEGDDVACLLQRAQVRELPAGFPFPPQLLFLWRVVEQQPHAQRADGLDDRPPHVSHADEPHRGGLQVEPFLLFQQDEARTDVLPHGVGVAARAVGPGDVRPFQVVGVQVVEPDGGRGDEGDLAAPEQRFIAACPRPDNQGVGIPHVVGRDASPRFIDDVVRYLGKRFPDERDFVVNNYFHAAKIDKKL